MAHKLVTGIFRNWMSAEVAIEEIMKHGYTESDVSVLMSDATRTKQFAFETGTKAVEGAGVGGAVGGSVGALAGAIAAVGSTLVLPGVGLVVAGPIAAALAGAGAGGAAGTLVGALVGLGIPEHRAEVYDSGLKKGGVLLGVESHGDDDVSYLKDVLEESGGERVQKE